MHTVIQRYQGDPKDLAELARRVGDSAREVLTTIPGFIGYALSDDGKGTLLTVGTFEDKAGADESTRRAAAWIREHAADVRLSAPSILEGETRILRTTTGLQANYGALRVFKVNPSSVDEYVRRADEFATLISKSPGFVRYSIIDAGNGTLASTSAFETQEQAENSVRLAADWIKQNLSPLLPNPPEITSAQVKVSWLK